MKRNRAIAVLSREPGRVLCDLAVTIPGFVPSRDTDMEARLKADTKALRQVLRTIKLRKTSGTRATQLIIRIISAHIELATVPCGHRNKLESKPYGDPTDRPLASQLLMEA